MKRGHWRCIYYVCKQKAKALNLILYLKEESHKDTIRWNHTIYIYFIVCALFVIFNSFLYFLIIQQLVSKPWLRSWAINCGEIQEQWKRQINGELKISWRKILECENCKWKHCWFRETSQSHWKAKWRTDWNV